MTRLRKEFAPLFIVLLLAGSLLLATGFAMATAPEPTATPAPIKSIFGQVMTEAGAPISRALVVAHRVQQRARNSTQTNQDGTYQLALGPGLWSVTVQPISGTVPADWVYPHVPQEALFEENGAPERQELNFTVAKADSVATGVVALPGGGVPPFPVSVGLHNGEGIGGRVQIDPRSGVFELALPAGRYDVVIFPHHDGYAGPEVEPVALTPGEKVDLGTLYLLKRDGRINGRVTDLHGRGLPGIPVSAWQDGRSGSVTARTGADGQFSLAVSAGIWTVQPTPGPTIPYLYLGQPRQVEVEPGAIVSGVNFSLLPADATIAGRLVDEDGNAVTDVAGWASAENQSLHRVRNGAPIVQGRFAIHVPRGSYLVDVHLPPGSPYFSSLGNQVTLQSGETVSLTVTLERKDAAIEGALVDPRQEGMPVTGVSGRVTAWSGDRWSATRILPESGRYHLGVAAGIWRLNYRIDQTSYVKLGGAANLPVQTGQTVTWPLPVTRRDAFLSGQVVGPDGRPLAGAMVIADGLGGEIGSVWLQTRSDREGRFRFRLPHGRYRLGATGGAPGWISPVELVVTPGPDSRSLGLTLQFRQPDAVLTGRLLLASDIQARQAFVWAWSDDGGFVYGRFPVSQPTDVDPASNRYRLGVISGTTWHVGAVVETENAFWSARGQIEVTGPLATLDLAFTGPHPKPPPVAVTFDAAEAQLLTLADGTEIFIPAGAMPVSGTVTLRILPLASLPFQRHAQLIQYGYAFYATSESGRPIEEQFNHDVIIRFRYERDSLSAANSELKPAYFSTTTNLWTVPEQYVVDTDRQLVIMAIDHFTNFSLTEVRAPVSAYLPLVVR